MTLKLEEGLRELGLTKLVILIVIIVEVGSETELMPVSSKYWTELSVKVVTGHVIYEVVVELV